MKVMEMKFKNPILKEGLNLTVRRGIKWALYSNECKNIPIKIYDTNKKSYGWIKLEKVILMPFDSIKDTDLKHEHDEKCRTKEGLKKFMNEVYEDFNDREVVSLIYFNKFEK